MWVDATDAAGPGGRTVWSYFRAFGPGPEWDEIPLWPPDVFALASLILDHTQSYRFVVAPPEGRRWPPLVDWNGQVRDAARAWAEACGRGDGPPPFVRRSWDVVTGRRDAPLATLRSGEAWEPIEALLSLHATADEACAKVATSGRRAPDRSFEGLAWHRLQERGTLSRLSPTRVRIVPKTHLSFHGITIRSLSRYLALCYESVDVRCRSVDAEPPAGREYAIVLVPWPLAVKGRDFRPAHPPALENMDAELFGFFEFTPEEPLDHELLRSTLSEALDRAGHVDAVVFPEAAVDARETDALEELLDDFGATFFIAGMREPPSGGALGRNYLLFGVRTALGWERHEQDKHHRWCLDGAQIRQYHLTRSLDPGRLWWEAIDVRERALHVVDVGHGVTVAPLVCEDLARLDEVADLVRRIGPSLVVALLLDGPQLASRWSCRYASILVDEPGSAVLTLTSSGMAARSRPPGKPRSRVIAHWNNGREGLHELELAPGAAALLLTASVDSKTLWTADGRRHLGVPGLTLSGLHQLHGRPASRRRTRARRTRPAPV